MTAERIHGLKKLNDPLPLLGAILCGIVASALTVHSPYIGIAAIAGLTAYSLMTLRAEIPLTMLVFSFAIPVQKQIAGIPLNMADGMIVLWGMAWPFLMMRRGKGVEELPFVAKAAIPLIVCALLSLLVAINPGGSLKQVIRLVEWFAVLPILMLSLKPGEDLWKWLRIAFLAIPVFFAMDGIVEVANNGNSITHMLGIPQPIPSSELSEIRHTFDVSGRAGSAFGGAQGLAMYLTMLMSVIVSIAIVSEQGKFKKAALLSLVICLIAMYFTKSRGGLLGSLVMFTVIALASRARAGVAIVISGGLLISAVFIWFLICHGWDGTVAGLVPGRPEAVLDRLIIWGRALSVFGESPLLGVGFGGFRDAVYDDGGIHLNVGLGYESLHCHNTYLEVLTGTGILGFLSYLGFLAACMARLVHLWRNRKGLPSDAFILAAIGALAAYMTFGMVDMLFLQNMHFILVSILTLGMMAGARKPEEERGPA